MSGLRVTPAQLEELGVVISRTSAEVRAQHDELRGRLGPLLFGADWAGAAAGRFGDLYEQFDRHAQGTSEALEAIGGLLKRAGLSYAEAEGHIAASFG